MFERNELYVLIDQQGLAKEALFSGSDIVEQIVKRGNMIKPVEVNAFGDVHAFMFGTGGFQHIEYIPREFIKYFETVAPVAIEATNIIPFPPKKKALPEPDDGWDALKLDIWCRNNGMKNSLIQAKPPTQLPIARFSSPEPIRRDYSQDYLPRLLDNAYVETADEQTVAELWGNIRNLHLEAKVYA